MRRWMMKIRQALRFKGKRREPTAQPSEQESVVTNVPLELEQVKPEPMTQTMRVKKVRLSRSSVRHDIQKEPVEDVQTTKEQYEEAVAECQRALRDWRSAQRKLDWALEADEIDYAIYSLIAAEKHYASTLKETKRIYQTMKSVAN